MASSYRMCEVESDTEHLSLDTIKKVIQEHSCIYHWCYILHDKDINKKGELKKPHYHVYLHFPESPQQFKYVAKWFGLDEQFVSKIKGQWKDAICYATHRNASEKFQYSFDEVTANFDFIKVTEKAIEDKKNKLKFSEIIEKIDSGEIREYNITSFISISDYVQFERKIKRAFEYKLKQLESEVNRKMQVLYLYGGSGCGKSTYAKMLADTHGYVPFISSGSNDPFDGYKGQECVILDDLRGSVFPLSDLLKILDNNTNSSVKARYKNISLQCNLLIITTTKTPDEFYKQVFESRDEEYKQFLRRCTQIGSVEKDFITFTRFNQFNYRHEFLTKIPNPVKQLSCLFNNNSDIDTDFFKVSNNTLDKFANNINNAIGSIDENDEIFNDLKALNDS